MPNKITLTKEEFDDVYEIIDKVEITGETEVALQAPEKQVTTPTLSQEEEELEDEYLQDYKIPEGADIT